MTRRTPVIAAAALAATLAAAPAEADDPSSLEAALAEPVVSTASKASEDQTAAPATTSIITADELRTYGIHSLDEAINYLSLGMITQNPLHAVEIGARGVLITGDYGNHVLLLLNGHAMNEQWDGTAYFERGAGIPFELIDHIEIILGPGSVLYGGNAMLGVINVITKRAKDYDGLHFIAESDLLTSERVAFGAGHELTLFGKRAEVTFQGEYYNQSGPAFTFAPQSVGDDSVTGKPVNFGPNTPRGVWGGTVTNQYYSHVPAGVLRLVWGDFELMIKASAYERATPYFNYVTTGGDFNNPNDFERDRFFFVDLKHRLSISSIVALHSRLYADTYDYRFQETSSAAQYCLPGQIHGCQVQELGASRWIGLEEQLMFDWLHEGTLTTLIGADGRLRYVGQRNDDTDLVTGKDPGSFGFVARNEAALGVYGQQTWRPVRWLFLNAGLRTDVDARFNGPKYSPRVAVAVKPWNGGTLKGIYAEAFRAPTTYETSFADGVQYLPSPNLKPESVRSFEASFEQRAGVHRVLFGVFQSTFSDMISNEALSATDPALAAAVKAGQLPAGTTIAFQNQNVSQISSFGYNAAFDGSALHRDLRFGLNVTGAYSRSQAGSGAESPLPAAPQVFGNGRISYRLPGSWPVLALVGQVIGSRPANAAFSGGFTPVPYAPPQVELRATISGPVPRVRGLSYRFSADYAFSGVTPYVAGPVQSALPTAPSAALAPVDRFRTTVGLQYSLR